MDEPIGHTPEKKRSSFAHAPLEAERIVHLKEGFEERLSRSDFTIKEEREGLIDQAEIIMAELGQFASGDERKRLELYISAMKAQDMRLTALMTMNLADDLKMTAMLREAAVFKDMSKKFLAAENLTAQNSNLSLQPVKDKSEITRLYKIGGIDPWFRNSFGIRISPEMEIFARHLTARAFADLDNVLVTEAIPGYGKSTFSLALGTTMYDLYNITLNPKLCWDLNMNVLFNESREYCEKLLINAPNFTYFMYDEAGNQVGSRSWWRDDQQDYTNALEKSRFHNRTLNYLWNKVEGLDKTVRDSRAQYVITIEQRGIAMVRTFNRNPHNRGLTGNTKNKKMVITTGEQATGILEYDPLTVLKIPFFDINHDPVSQKFWDAYIERKKASDKAGPRNINSKTRLDVVYTAFIAGLRPDATRITSEQLYDYGVSVHTALSMKALAKRLAAVTGQKTSKIYTNTDMADSDIGYITVDPYIAAYIQKVAAQRAGAAEYKKEDENGREA